MIKAISNSFVPIFKWVSVAAVSAAVVISIQASADGQTSEVVPALDVQDLPVNAVPAAQTPVRNQPWTPANGFADLIEDVSPAVVHVATAGVIQQRRLGGGSREFRGPRGFEDFFNDFFGDRRVPSDPRRQDPAPETEEEEAERQTRPLGIGSGFIISADGYVVTNHHVIDRADEIIVTLTDGTEYEAEIKGSDPKTDLAVLKLKDANGLPFVPWGNDRESRVGDWVLAIGNPLGLGGSASTGIISAIGRDINAGPYDDFIQVDAAINRGNSGGPLFNMNGEVIGINSMIYSPSGGSVGIGFSIPASLAKGVIGQLQNSGEVERGWIGVSIGPVSDELAEVFKRPNDEGALISQVLEDSPAQKAGIVAGDIVLKFDGNRVKEMRDLPKQVAQAKVGETYKLEVWRDGKTKTIKIKTEPYPSDSAQASTGDSGAPLSEPETDKLLGADISELTNENRQQYRIPEDVEGVLLLSVERAGLAAKNGLRPGDVIVQFGADKNIQKPEQVTKVLKAAKKAKQSSIAVLINRRGNPGFLVFKTN